MKKNFILDTNVLLHDPNALFQFSDNNIIIPIYVIEEIDMFKKELSELGRNARYASRQLDNLRSKGSLSKGVKINNDGTLRVGFAEAPLPKILGEPHKMDTLILSTALSVYNKDPNTPTILVSKDTNLRVKADALGIKAEDYDTIGEDISELYSGLTDVTFSKDEIDKFYKDGQIGVTKLDAYPNEFIMLVDENNPSHTALGKYYAKNKVIEPLIPVRDGIWGVRAKNKEQSFCLDLLLTDRIKLVTIVGKAGTGKTLLAIAAGLQKTTEEKVYSKLLVSRPIFPLGRDIGYLPGDIEEKLNPWMQPIYDNLDFLLNTGTSKTKSTGSADYQELLDLGLIEIEPLTYIRGRSIPNQFMIIDEAQNLTPHEVKTIITRVGHGTKIIFTGDPYQIDHPYVDSVNNGLTYLVNKFKEEEIAGHITLVKGERSELAELAANLL